MNEEVLKLKKELVCEKQKRIDLEKELLKRTHEAEENRRIEEISRLELEEDYNRLYNENINLKIKMIYYENK